MAIDHRGCRVIERAVPIGADLDAAWAGLQALLDRADPILRAPLTLVRAS